MKSLEFERISVAENRVARLSERLERTLDLLLRYAQNAYFDRSLIRALVGLLTEDGLVDTERLEREARRGVGSVARRSSGVESNARVGGVVRDRRALVTRASEL